MVKYRAFISYRHSEVSRAHALALERALKRYAKPLFKPPMRVFRDEQILRPGDDLPRTIRTALEVSEWLLVLAEKGAAESPWVADEVRIWCGELGRADRLVIVHIADEIGVDAEAQRIDWAGTNALPRELEKHLTSLPIYADLSWATRDQDRDLSNSRYKSLINGLMARIRGVTPESMMGAEVLTHRRNVRLRNIGITTVVISAILAVAFGLVAVQRSREAEDRSAFLRSQRLAAQSTVELQSGRLDLALLLGVEAFHPLEEMRERQRTDAFAATSALFRATYFNPRLRAYLLRSSGLGDARFSLAGRVMALPAGGGLTLWDAGSFMRLPETIDSVEVVDRAIPPERDLLAILMKRAVAIVDAQTLDLLKAFKTGQEGALYGPALAPDGGTIAVGAGENSVFLWNLAEPQSQARFLRGHSSNVVSLAFSPDGSTLATGSWDSTIRVWDVASGELLGAPLENPGQVEDLVFSPDGEILVAATGGSINLWDTATWKPIGRPLHHDGKISSVSVSPDGALIASAGPDTPDVLLWSLPSRRSLGRLEGHASGLKQVAFAPQGEHLVSISHTGTVILWRDVANGLPGETSAGGFEEPRALAASGDDDLIAVGDCGESRERMRCTGGRISLLRYEPTTRNRWPRLAREGDSWRGHPGSIESLAFADGELEVTSASCAGFSGSTCQGALVHRWRPGESVPLTERRLATEIEIDEMEFDAEGEILAGAVPDRRRPAWSGGPKQYEVWLWDTLAGEQIGEPWRGGDRLLIDLDFSRFEPRLFAASSFDKAFIWRLDTGERLFDVEGGKVAFDEAGSTMVTKIKGVFQQTRILIWSAATGELIQEITTPTSEVAGSTALSSDGRLFAMGGADGTLAIWDLGVGQMMGLPLRVHSEGVRGLAFGGDGRVLYSVGGDDRVVALELDVPRWRIRACRTARRNLTHDEWVQFFKAELYRLTCADLPVHASLLDAGRKLAAAGDVEGGVALMARAAELGDSRVYDPNEETRSLASEGFLERAKAAAEAARIEAATESFRRAKELDPELELDPAREAARIAAPRILDRVDRLARLHRTREALAAVERAQEFAPELAVAASIWHRLCRSGIVSGDATEVGDACDRAIELSEGRSNYFAARGVVRAITGDTEAAIADFEAYLAFEAQPMRFRGDVRNGIEARARVERWLEAARTGNLSLTKEDIASFEAELW